LSLQLSKLIVYILVQALLLFGFSLKPVQASNLTSSYLKQPTFEELKKPREILNKLALIREALAARLKTGRPPAWASDVFEEVSVSSDGLFIKPKNTQQTYLATTSLYTDKKHNIPLGWVFPDIKAYLYSIPIHEFEDHGNITGDGMSDERLTELTIPDVTQALERISTIDQAVGIKIHDPETLIEVLQNPTILHVEETTDMFAVYLSLLARIDGAYSQETDLAFKGSTPYSQLLYMENPVSEYEFRALWKESLNQVTNKDTETLKQRIPTSLLPVQDTYADQELTEALRRFLAKHRLFALRRHPDSRITTPFDWLTPFMIRQTLIRADSEKVPVVSQDKKIGDVTQLHLAKPTEFDELREALLGSGHQIDVGILSHTLTITDEPKTHTITLDDSSRTLTTLVELARAVTGNTALSVSDILRGDFNKVVTRIWTDLTHPDWDHRDQTTKRILIASAFGINDTSDAQLAEASQRLDK
jgi:hypothetical protein